MKSPNHQIVHLFRLEKHSVRRTNRLIRVRRLMCLLSIFCVFSFSHVMLLGIDMPLVGPLSVGGILRDAKRLQQLLQPCKKTESLRRPNIYANNLPACGDPWRARAILDSLSH